MIFRIAVLYFFILNYHISVILCQNCSNYTLFDVKLDEKLLEKHLFSMYTVKQINKTCGIINLCINHNGDVSMHESMDKLSKMWLDPKLRDEICSELSQVCIGNLIKASNKTKYRNLTIASYNLMCQTSLETSNDQCIMGTLEAIQYSYLHYSREVYSSFVNSTNCNPKINLTNSSLCSQMKSQFNCLTTLCSPDGIRNYVNKVYPKMAYSLAQRSEDKSTYCESIKNGKSTHKRIVVNFIKNVSMKSAILGIVLLIILSIIALFMTCHFTGRFSVINAGRRYIPLRTKQDNFTGSIPSNVDHEDDLKRDEEKSRLLPEKTT